MIKRKRVETITEKRTVLIVRRSGVLPAANCASCAQGAAMLRPEEAARLTGVSTRTVFRWVEDGSVHFDETPEGDLLVCLASLPALAG